MNMITPDFQIIYGAGEVLRHDICDHLSACREYALTCNMKIIFMKTIILFSLFLLSPTFGSAQGPTPPVSHWKFDETSGTTAFDASANGNNLTLSGGASFAPGKLGNALSVNGTTGKAVDTVTTGLNPTSVLTIAAWVKPTSFTNSHFSTIVRKGSRSNDRGYSMLFLGDNLFFNRVCCGAGVESVSVPVDGTFHHVAITWNNAASQVRFYLDGVLVETANSPGVIGTPLDADPLSVGYNLDEAGGGPLGFLPGSPYSGLIDDLRIYHRVLSGAEISALLAGTTTPPTTPPPRPPPPAVPHVELTITPALRMRT